MSMILNKNMIPYLSTSSIANERITLSFTHPIVTIIHFMTKQEHDCRNNHGNRIWMTQ